MVDSLKKEIKMETGSKTKPTVLIIDDEISSLDLLYELLKDSYTVVGSPDPEIVTQMLERKVYPDLILLDVNMPKINGYDICKLVKNDDGAKDVPIIFVTSSDGFNDELHGFEVGASDFIGKPFHPAIVKARIGTHILLKQKNEELKAKILQLEKTVRAFENKITRSNINTQLDKKTPPSAAEAYSESNTFLDDHIQDFIELEEIMDSKVSLMCMRGHITSDDMTSVSIAMNRYGDILLLYPNFMMLGGSLKEFAFSINHIDPTLKAKNSKMALECLETLSFTLAHWRKQLFSGALKDPNAFDKSLLADIKTILKIVGVEQPEEDDEDEIELF